MNLDNFPCTCGHPRYAHEQMNEFLQHKACFYLGQGTSIDDCECMDFTLDNLAFMEQRYDETK